MRANAAKAAAPGAKFGVLPAVRPSRRADEADHGADAAVAQAGEDEVALTPVRLAALGLDPVPVQVEANEVGAEPLEPVEPVVQRPRAVGQPGVVLDAVANPARRSR